MGELKFSDGVSFNTDGDLRVEHRHDGYYVVGKGMLSWEGDTYEEAKKALDELNERK